MYQISYHVYIHIYIYIQRYVYAYTYACIYLYIYMYILETYNWNIGTHDRGMSVKQMNDANNSNGIKEDSHVYQRDMQWGYML